METPAPADADPDAGADADADADARDYREELRARRNRFIAESSAEFADADADEVAELLAEAKRKR